MTDDQARKSLPLAGGGRCFRKDCGRPGWWKPVLLVWAKGFDKDRYPPVRLELGFLLCKRHKREFQPDDVITPIGWTRIEAVFAGLGKAEPDMQSIEVDFEKIPAEG